MKIADGLRPHDVTLLRHVALHRLSTKEAAAVLLGLDDPARAGTALSALERLGYAVSGSLTGGVRYYSLSPKGAAVVGVPKERGEPLGPAALACHLAVLWFCFLGERRRHRLEHDELRGLFGDDTPFHNVPHCAADEPDGRCVYRVHEASGQAENVVRGTCQHVRRARMKPALRTAMESGAYRFAVLAETPEKCQHVRQLLERSDDAAISDGAARIVVRFAPSPRTLPDAMARLREAMRP